METHVNRTVLRVYQETRQSMPDLMTGDGQRIAVYSVLCKLACECGHIGLEEFLIVDEPAPE